ncbi:MAG TPA: hypothetical protein VL996_01630 [Methylocella sp.]|nr:hypothetical protein [Methylocella sp.]
MVIQVIEPTLNKQGPKWKDTLQFKQEDDERLQLSDLPTIAERQNELREEIQRVLETVTRQISRLSK